MSSWRKIGNKIDMFGYSQIFKTITLVIIIILKHESGNIVKK